MQMKCDWLKALMLALVLALTFPVVPSTASPEVYGPRLDKLRFRVVKGSPAIKKALRQDTIDVYTPLTTPNGFEVAQMDGQLQSGHLMTLSGDGFRVLDTSGFHFSYIAFNLRSSDVDPENGIPEAGFPATEDKRCLLDPAFRHAVAHLIPKPMIIGSLFWVCYSAFQADTPCPPGTRYYNPGTPRHDFDPDEAKQILYDAGYTYDGVQWSYPEGDAIGTIRIVSPTLEEDPTSWTIVRMLVMQMESIGLKSVLQDPQASPYPLVWVTMLRHRFDMYFGAWGDGRFPDFLWELFHSENDMLYGYNTPGVNSTEIDDLANILKTSLDLAEVIAASKEIQYKLMDPSNDYALCYIPIYHLNPFGMYDPDLEGIIRMPGYGTYNKWTLLNLRWSGVVGGSVNWGVGYEPYAFNPLYTVSAPEWAIMYPIYDGLIEVDPYSTDDMAGLSTDWSIEKYPDPDTGPGMRINYTLRSGVKWHDSSYFSASDVKFCYDYMYEFTPEVWTDIYTFYDHCDIVDAGGATGGGKISVFTTTTGLFMVYDYAGVMALLPPQVWTHVGGTAAGMPLTKDPGTLIYNDLHDGPPIEFEPWKTDHPDAVQIEKPYDPGNYFTLSCLFGTGPWVFEEYDEVAMYADLVANRQWRMSQDGVHALLQDMFHWFGDVNWDGVDDIEDIIAVAMAWGTSVPPGDDRDLAPRHETRADIHPVDGFIDIEDIYVVAGAFAKRKEY